MNQRVQPKLSTSTSSMMKTEAKPKPQKRTKMAMLMRMRPMMATTKTAMMKTTSHRKSPAPNKLTRRQQLLKKKEAMQESVRRASLAVEKANNHANNELLGRIKVGLRLIQNNGLNVSQAAKQAGLMRPTLNAYITANQHRDASSVQLIKSGRRPFLSIEGMKILRVFVHMMDGCGFELSLETVRQVVLKLRARDDEMHPHLMKRRVSSDPKSTVDRKTLNRIIQEIGISVRHVRHGPGVDALRETKCTPKFLNSFFEVLSPLYSKYQLTPDRM